MWRTFSMWYMFFTFLMWRNFATWQSVIWKFFSTSTAGDAGDKYQVCPQDPHHGHLIIDTFSSSGDFLHPSSSHTGHVFRVTPQSGAYSGFLNSLEHITLYISSDNTIMSRQKIHKIPHRVTQQSGVCSSFYSFIQLSDLGFEFGSELNPWWYFRCHLLIFFGF